MGGTQGDTTGRDTFKAQVGERIDALAPVLLEVSHDIWEHPELCFEEHHAHDLLCDPLERHGLATTRHAYGLETAFEARAGDAGTPCRGDLRVRRPAGDRPRLRPQHHRRRRARRGAGRRRGGRRAAGGRVRILGTPAEEGGGGKVFMARAGALDGVDVRR